VLNIFNTRNKIVKNFFHVELEAILKHIHGLILAYREEKGLGDNKFAKMAQLPKTALVPIEGEKRTDKGKLRTIDLATLKERILTYLRTTTEENSTSVGNGKQSLVKRVPDFLAGDPEGEEKVRERTQWRIFHLQQDIAVRDKLIADLRETLKKAGITDDTKHDLPIQDS
jgi:DNA-binding XRE family transcriptional regulator